MNKGNVQLSYSKVEQHWRKFYRFFLYILNIYFSDIWTFEINFFFTFLPLLSVLFFWLLYGSFCRSGILALPRKQPWVHLETEKLMFT